MQTAYETTRGLLVPLLVTSFDDDVTTENWITPAGKLEWNNRWGYRMFHVDSGVIEHDGFDAVSQVPFSRRLFNKIHSISSQITWFGRPGTRAFLRRFFRGSGDSDIGCVEVQYWAQDEQGNNHWEDVRYATDSMIAFGLAWVSLRCTLSYQYRTSASDRWRR